MTDKQLLEQALEALESCMYPQQKQIQTITAIKQALAAPVQEPVAWLIDNDYTTLFLDIADIHKSRGANVEPLVRAVKTPPAAQQAPVQEPVATLWQHGRTRRTRVTMPDQITDCDADWVKVSDLYTTPPATQEEIQRLSALVRAQQITIDKLEKNT
jgi:hypothetical protein